jgi:hypothetical protein
MRLFYRPQHAEPRKPVAALAVAALTALAVLTGVLTYTPGHGSPRVPAADYRKPAPVHSVSSVEEQRALMIRNAALPVILHRPKPKPVPVSSVASGELGSAPSPAPAPAPVFPAPDPGTAQSVGYNMLASFGFATSQWSCLDQLWNRESGWVYNATNPTSGAYGIPQALPADKMASAGADWLTDPATQIKWGLGYIKSVYGTPCGAWAHELADGWY